MVTLDCRRTNGGLGRTQQPRGFLIGILPAKDGGPLSLTHEEYGFYLQCLTTPASAVVFASDYPLPDLTSFHEELIHRGVVALEQIPDNIVCMGYAPES